MKVRRYNEKVILGPEDIGPSSPQMKVVGVFNPGCAQYGEYYYLLARVSECIKKKRKDHVSSPRIKDGKLAIDWLRKGSLADYPKEQYLLPSGLRRLAFISHLKLVKLDRQLNVVSIKKTPAFFPKNNTEEFGLEDSRITRIGHSYYIAYSACGHQNNITPCLSVTSDFKTFKYSGCLFPPENKNVVLFPEKIKGYYYCLHRPVPKYPFSKPCVFISKSPDLIHWGDHQPLFWTRESGWDSEKLGAGTPPVKTSKGWLLLYHGVSLRGGKTYSAGAILLEKHNPHKILARSRNALLLPENPYEKSGYVGNVIFPTGLYLNTLKQELQVFSGASDTYITSLTLKLEDVWSHLAV